METFDSWIVAAAILATGDEYSQELHYRTLADRVVKTELTTLGLKGSNPEQSLGVVLRQHFDVFIRGDYRGYYRLKNPEEVAKRSDVGRAIQALERLQQEKQAVGEREALREEVQRLRQQNALLERKMAEIAEICNPLIEA